ncbi:MAG: hypothetical protein COA96_02470 [SAR86 cluster bacterium]|uniref:Uncharacterized protein n=1 Tax=SAR86 cluster bacterium TaxID=2030880 RepID=A0A2A5B816_9GAMM|nr:MAG: hypothetical protein COA96_02470 [SAR86 cluster bacterium]
MGFPGITTDKILLQIQCYSDLRITKLNHGITQQITVANYNAKQASTLIERQIRPQYLKYWCIWFSR